MKEQKLDRSMMNKTRKREKKNEEIFDREFHIVLLITFKENFARLTSHPGATFSQIASSTKNKWNAQHSSRYRLFQPDFTMHLDAYR